MKGKRMPIHIVDDRGQRAQRTGRKAIASGLVKATAVVVAVGAILVGSALPASAYVNNGWVWDHDGTQSHIYTNWTDGTTYNTRISVEHVHTTTVCNYKAKAAGTRSTGTSYSSTFGAVSGCTWFVGASVTNPNIYFKGGSRLTGQFQEGSDWRAPVGINV